MDETAQMPIVNNGKLYAAMAAVQAELKHAELDGTNPHYRSKYATLRSVIDAIKPHLKKHGLCIMQVPDGDYLNTIIGHESGQFMMGRYPIKPVKEGPQARGAEISYARRYSLAAMCCISAEEDDDGERAEVRNPVQSENPAPDEYVVPAEKPKRKPRATKASSEPQLNFNELPPCPECGGKTGNSKYGGGLYCYTGWKEKNCKWKGTLEEAQDANHDAVVDAAHEAFGTSKDDEIPF
jgi:hypothetical protein